MQAGIRKDMVCEVQIHLVHPIMHVYTALSDFYYSNGKRFGSFCGVCRSRYCCLVPEAEPVDLPAVLQSHGCLTPPNTMMADHIGDLSAVLTEDQRGMYRCPIYL